MARSARRRCDHRAGFRGRRSSRHVLVDDLSTQVGTFALLPQIVQAVDLPVIAAGGIADAKGVAAAMALGAAGVQVGTAYLLCPEATTSCRAQGGAQERRRPSHGGHESLHRSAGAGHREPHHAGARAGQHGGSRLSAGVIGAGFVAREGGKRRAAMISRRCGRDRMPAGAGRFRPRISRAIWRKDTLISRDGQQGQYGRSVSWMNTRLYRQPTIPRRV